MDRPDASWEQADSHPCCSPSVASSANPSIGSLREKGRSDPALVLTGIAGPTDAGERQLWVRPLRWDLACPLKTAVAIPGHSSNSQYHQPGCANPRCQESRDAPVLGTWHYTNAFWGKHVTRAEYPDVKCDFWVSMTFGYGGIVMAMFPNGTSFYRFSDSDEAHWYEAMTELDKISPMCKIQR